MNVLVASDLFEVEYKGVYPLNIRFETKKPFASYVYGIGIYLLFYRQKIIYIGLAYDESPISRFRKQLETITLRGEQVSFNLSCKRAILSSSILQSTFQNVLKNQFKGKETSLGRISFAEQCWSEFSQFDIQHLKNFVFVWFPYSSHSKEELIDLKKDLIQKLRPFCNG